MLWWAVSATDFLGCEQDAGQVLRKQVTIERTTTANFMRSIAKTPALTRSERRLIRGAVRRRIYTHCRLRKYELNGQWLMEIDQCLPWEATGRESARDLQIQGASGHLSVYRLQNNGFWASFSDVFYD